MLLQARERIIVHATLQGEAVEAAGGADGVAGPDE